MPTIDGVLNGLIRFVLPAAAIAAAGVGAIAVFDHLDVDRRAAERRFLLQRNTELTVGALAPGSALACLDGGAGEAVENACERAVFADPQSAAAAVAYTAARLDLLKGATALADGGDAAIAGSFAATRRAVELDRYGIAAHVLAERDGCTAERCAAFGWLNDTAALKANLKARAFETYVARYAVAWNKPKPDSEPNSEPVAAKQPAAAPPAPVAGASEPPGHAVANKYDFPSAASIPPVSIMNAEPPLPKAAEAPTAPATGDTPAPVAKLPPKRPQSQAATPPGR